MWYFSWILGVGLAATFAILNGIWFELREIDRHSKKPSDEETKAPPSSEPVVSEISDTSGSA